MLTAGVLRAEWLCLCGCGNSLRGASRGHGNSWGGRLWECDLRGNQVVFHPCTTLDPSSSAGNYPRIMGVAQNLKLI